MSHIQDRDPSEFSLPTCVLFVFLRSSWSIHLNISCSKTMAVTSELGTFFGAHLRSVSLLGALPSVNLELHRVGIHLQKPPDLKVT